MEKIPLVSVIIPMYNAARFIEQTLESLRRQTLKDFEVIVIDDASTDNSIEAVENFAPRLFQVGIKIQVLEMPQNTGTPALPRNFGLQVARGKYAAFLDADDLFTPTALEELTALAEEYQADVINMTEFYRFFDGQLNAATVDDLLNVNNLELVTCRGEESVPLKSALLAPDDIAERVKLWLNDDFHWATCGLFCRRDFLIVNQIFFPNMLLCEDQVVQFSCVCLAEKLLRAPNVTYIVRRNADSISREDMPVENYFHKWISSLNVGFNEFSKFMNSLPFFQEHIGYRYAVLNWFFERVMSDAPEFSTSYEEIPLPLLDKFVQQEFCSEDAAFSAYLFNSLNICRLQVALLEAELAKFHKQ